MIKLLTIDDNDSNLLLISELLSETFPNYLIITARSGEEGILKAKEEQPDVILLDLFMPVMDGFETCKILKNDKLTKEIPIIILTAAEGQFENRTKIFSLGAEAYLTKPIDRFALASVISSMLKIKEKESNLINENLLLEEIVNTRTKELQNELEIRKNTEIELNKLNQSIKASKLAAINLLEDLKIEIEEKNLTSEALKESEETFRHSFDYSATGMCIIGIDGKFQRINKVFKNIFGYSEEEIKELTFNNITYPEDVTYGDSRVKKN